MSIIDFKKLHDFSMPIKDFFDSRILDLGITYSFHIRRFNDGRAYVLGNNPEYVMHFLRNGYAVPEPVDYDNFEIELWTGNIGLQTFDKQVAEMRDIFNIDHQITFFYPHSDYLDIYDLGTIPQRPDLINYCINNVDILDKLFQEYRENFSDVLNELNQQPMNFPIRPRDFGKNIRAINKFDKITDREFECLNELAKAGTSKSIAQKLCISHRTVDRHLENIRSKLQLKYKVEIVKEYLEYLRQPRG
jgi:DNA-binding CsgD family transcriptional regulator